MLKRLSDGDAVVVWAGDFRYQDGTLIEDKEPVWNLYERGLLTVLNSDPHRFILTNGGREAVAQRVASTAENEG